MNSRRLMLYRGTSSPVGWHLPCSAQTIAHPVRRECAALRDFSPHYVR
jgi:hypothetical protein